MLGVLETDSVARDGKLSRPTMSQPLMIHRSWGRDRLGGGGRSHRSKSEFRLFSPQTDVCHKDGGNRLSRSRGLFSPQRQVEPGLGSVEDGITVQPVDGSPPLPLVGWGPAPALRLKNSLKANDWNKDDSPVGADEKVLIKKAMVGAIYRRPTGRCRTHHV